MDPDGPLRPGGPSASGGRPAGTARTGVAQRLRLDVAYDGSGFHGFAENRGVATVAGALRSALERLLGVPVALTCAGRTDTGVHAAGQVVSVEVPAGARALDHRRLRDGANALVGPSVVVRAVADAPDGFDARHSARARSYRYRVLNREVPDPFLAATAWWVDEPLDRAAMAAAARHLLGEHDFSSFCRRPKGDPGASLVRRVLAADWHDLGPAHGGADGLVELRITATAFCHQMVRSITGLLVDVGRGRRRPDDVRTALAARDRATVGQLAPPHGLTLWQVHYE